MPAEGFQHAFAQNAPDDVKAITASVQRPIAVRCIQEPALKPAWRSKPSWFLIAKNCDPPCKGGREKTFDHNTDI
jgi:hypothetical protein